MPHLPSYLHPLFFSMQMWHLLLSIYIFATYFQGENCANPFFFVQWKNRGRAYIFSLKRARRICALPATCVVNVHIFHPNLPC